MSLKTVTFNLRMNTMKDGINYFFNRSPFILRRIRAEQPDIIGFQEATRDIHAWLNASLDGYTIVGMGRNADFSGEANPVAFRRDRFELFGLHQFWLSETPDIPGSRYEHQSHCPRILLSVKLRDRATGQMIYFYNTHLDHVDDEARLLGIRQVLEEIRSDFAKAPATVILTGDMNATPDEASMLEVARSKSPSLTDASGAIVNTFHGYHGGSSTEADRGKKIDYIFTNITDRLNRTYAWEDENNGIYLSDHYPVVCEFNFT